MTGGGLRLSLLTCGWTTHPGAIARRGAPWRPERFPALVAVVDHPDGLILFDTGYAPRVVRALSRGIDRVYGGLLPVRVTPAETAVAQLAAAGHAAGRVRTVVVSHLHADHIGGLRDFPGARVVVDPTAVAAARRARGFGRLRRGLVPALLPGDLADRLIDPTALPPAAAADPGPGAADLAPFDARDLTGDGRVLVVPLPGHSAGQLGLCVRTPNRDLLFLADAVWRLRAVTHGELPHPVVRAVTAQPARYAATVAALRDLTRRRPDLLLVPSHDEGAIAAARAALAGGDSALGAAGAAGLPAGAEPAGGAEPPGNDIR